MPKISMIFSLPKAMQLPKTASFSSKYGEDKQQELFLRYWESGNSKGILEPDSLGSEAI